jgi:hypothetical protein
MSFNLVMAGQTRPSGLGDIPGSRFAYPGMEPK